MTFNGQTPDERILPLMPELLPRLGEKVAIATLQMEMADNIVNLVRLTAPGRSFECFIDGPGLMSWARQWGFYGKHTAMGLVVPDGAVIPDDFTF